MVWTHHGPRATGWPTTSIHGELQQQQPQQQLDVKLKFIKWKGLKDYLFVGPLSFMSVVLLIDSHCIIWDKPLVFISCDQSLCSFGGRGVTQFLVRSQLYQSTAADSLPLNLPTVYMHTHLHSYVGFQHKHYATYCRTRSTCMGVEFKECSISGALNITEPPDEYFLESCMVTGTSLYAVTTVLRQFVSNNSSCVMSTFRLFSPHLSWKKKSAC